MTLDQNTPVIRHRDGTTLLAGDLPRTLNASDIVAGNRYGPWLALVTHRGPDAPPRPETLPVGTRVRRGPSWSWDDQDGTQGNLGTVMGHGWQRWFLVKWDGAQGAVSYRHGGDYTGEFSGPLYDLEVVSLPEAPAEPKPLVPAAFFERACIPPRTDGGRAGASASVVVLPAQRLDVTVIDDAMQHAQRASIDKEWVERALSSGGTRTFIQGAWSPEDVDVKREGDVITLTYKVPDFIRLNVKVTPAPPRAVGTYGPNPHEGTASNLPSEDYTPAHVLARRKAVVSTPTDLDDHLIPDAEPTGIVPRK